MIELVSVPVQEVATGQNVLFENAALHTGCAERHRAGSGVVTIAKPGIYLVTFNADIAIPTGGEVGEIRAALELDGESLPGSEMSVTPAAVENYFNVSTSHLVRMCCPCCVNISAANASTQAINFRNANLTVERKA